MDEQLSEQYNDGVVPAPHVEMIPVRLQRPRWQPTAVQVQQAEEVLLRNALILGAILLGMALLIGAIAWSLA